ncbi:hypothetical protein BGW42_008116, partial [Actinomortierella wolfii]
MPSPWTSVLGGTNRYLSEIRNVVKSSEDVKQIWNCRPEDVTILALDLGTEGLVGSTVFLPEGVSHIRQLKKQKTGRKKRRKRSKRGSRSSNKSRIPLRTFDLFVKRRAVAQPTKKFQSWLDSKKQTTICRGNKTISDAESSLAPLRGEGASVRNHLEGYKTAEGNGRINGRNLDEANLDAFYNQSNLWKHKWDAQRARKEEFDRVANSLFKMVGGSLGEKRREDQK